jgi:uncharacterized protein with PIN domain
MDASTGRPQVQSLAACLADLGPGSRCPCCGGWLEAIGASRRIRGAVAPSTAKRSSGARLLCPECGCEVEAVDDVPQMESCRAYCVAA